MNRALSKLSYRFRKLMPPLGFHGLKVRLSGAHVSWGVWKRVTRGDYEKPELDALMALLKPEDRLLELGCGMGLVSGTVAKKYPLLQVQTYEANPSLLPVIHELHKMNDIRNVSVNNAVLVNSKTSGLRDFYLHKSFAVGSLVPPSITAVSTIQVDETDVRAVLSSFKPDVLLCDIEGGEAELFPGLDLSGLRAVIVELHPLVIGRRAEALIYDALAASGLYPRIELCSGTVVAFEAVAAA